MKWYTLQLLQSTSVDFLSLLNIQLRFLEIGHRSTTEVIKTTPTPPTNIKNIYEILNNFPATGSNDVSNSHMKYLGWNAIQCSQISQAAHQYSQDLETCHIVHVLNLPKSPHFSSFYCPVSLLPSLSRHHQKLISNKFHWNVPLSLYIMSFIRLKHSITTLHTKFPHPVTS